MIAKRTEVSNATSVRDTAFEIGQILTRLLTAKALIIKEQTSWRAAVVVMHFSRGYRERSRMCILCWHLCHYERILKMRSIDLLLERSHKHTSSDLIVGFYFRRMRACRVLSLKSQRVRCTNNRKSASDVPQTKLFKNLALSSCLNSFTKTFH